MTKIYNAEIIDCALKIKDSLVICDLHLGYETALNQNGILIPQFQYKKIINKLYKIREKTCANKIIINGDLKHSFQKIQKQENKEILGLLDYLDKYYDEIIIIKGNHDNLTQYITQERNIILKDYYIEDNYYITHGHQIPESIPENIKTIIIGHEHPSITLRNHERIEKIKIYLTGLWNNKNLIVQPTFKFLSYGQDMLQKRTLSPFLDDINYLDFNVYGVDDFNTFYFGTLNELLEFQQENKEI
ncbi:MAG: metallophosphoesterase [Methanobacteriaceae archaeon]|nr:metallophosphoesterase [Methanobacteriaceae archaeon]